MPENKMTAEQQKVLKTIREFRESLTGHEKLAIKQAFGDQLSDIDVDLYSNAMAFIAKRREGLSDDDAKDIALNMADKEIDAMFDLTSDDGGDDPREIVPAEFGGQPETEAGKDAESLG